MSESATLERERRLATPAAIAAFAGLALYIVSVLIEQGTGLETGGAKDEQLRSFDANSGTLLLATLLRSVGFLAISLPLFHLFRAARARNPKVRPEMVAFAFIGPVILAAQGIMAWIASSQVSSDFLSRTGVSDPAALAQRLLDDDSTRKLASALLIPAVLGLMVGLVYISLQAMRVGLLTRFVGTLGMALGASMFLIFPIALLATLTWLVFIGLIFVDKVPGSGRPPAWDSAEAVPWEPPEPRRIGGGGLFGPRPAAGAEADDEAVDTGGTEVTPADPSNPPRERGERRKRKRRR